MTRKEFSKRQVLARYGSTQVRCVVCGSTIPKSWMWKHVGTKRCAIAAERKRI